MQTTKKWVGRVSFASSTLNQRRLIAFALVFTVGYSLLAILAVSPNQRIAHFNKYQVRHDEDVIRRAWRMLQYYGAMQGDAFIYYEHGMRFLGRSLANDDQEVVKHLSTLAPAEQNVAKSLLPYRDFECQYPPLAVHYFRMLAALSPNFHVSLSSFKDFEWHLSDCDSPLCVFVSQPFVARQYLADSVLCRSCTGRRVVWSSVVVPIRLCRCLFSCCESGSRRFGANALAGGLWCASVLLKVFPVFMGPVIVIWIVYTRGLRGVIPFVMAAGVIALVILYPWLRYDVTLGLRGINSQAGRQYLEYGSVFASFLITAKAVGVYDFQFGDELLSPHRSIESEPLTCEGGAVLDPAGRERRLRVVLDKGDSTCRCRSRTRSGRESSIRRRTHAELACGLRLFTSILSPIHHMATLAGTFSWRLCRPA